MDIRNYPVVILLFTLRGCPACAMVKPIFEKYGKQYTKCLPTLVLDVGMNSELVTHFKLKSAPSMLVVRKGKRSGKILVGAIEEGKIAKLFASASRGLECQL